MLSGMNTAPLIKHLYTLCGYILLAMLAFIVSRQSSYSLIADNAIMLEFARRIAEGGRLGLDYADTNFPHTIMLYLPAVLLSKLDGTPLFFAFDLYIYTLALLSAFLCWRLLIALELFDKRAATFAAGFYLIAALCLAGIHLGQRDHLVLLGLLPLLLAQICLNENIRLAPRLLYPALVFGALMVMVKPHYGLAPALLLLVPYLQIRTFDYIFRRPDFLVLSGITAVTLLANLFFFGDFYQTFFTDIVELYAGLQGHMFTLKFAILLVLFIAAFPLTVSKLEGRPRRLCLSLLAACFCALIAYYAQHKGFQYHLIPAFILAAFYFFCLAVLYVRKDWAPPAIALLGTLALFILFPVNNEYPRHGDVARLPVAKLLAEKCGEPCAFFMTNEYNFMAYETALYTGATFASRFPSLWFDPYFACAFRGEASDAAQARLKKYAAMLAEDLERGKPALIITYAGDYTCPDGTVVPPAYPGVYSRDESFAKAWAPYAKDEPLTLNRRDYFRGTDADYDHMLTFDVYRRTQ